MVDIEAWFRQRALVEEKIKDSKLGLAMRHMPSGYESVNVMWMWAALLGLNISSWLQALTGHDGAEERAHGKRLRRELVCVAARVTRHAKRFEVHAAPEDWTTTDPSGRRGEHSMPCSPRRARSSQEAHGRPTDRRDGHLGHLRRPLPVHDGDEWDGQGPGVRDLTEGRNAHQRGGRPLDGRAVVTGNHRFRRGRGRPRPAPQVPALKGWSDSLGLAREGARLGLDMDGSHRRGRRGRAPTVHSRCGHHRHVAAVRTFGPCPMARPAAPWVSWPAVPGSDQRLGCRASERCCRLRSRPPV